jgi:hypothetical protein
VVILLEILRFHAGMFIGLMDHLRHIEGVLDDISKEESRPKSTNWLMAIQDKPTIVFGENRKNHLNSILDIISDECKRFELESALILINSIKIKLKYNPQTKALKENIDTLHTLIEGEIAKHIFIKIPQKRIEWFNKKNTFGEQVFKAFTKATKDIEEAVNCYAIGLFTACVFHLSRVAEYGLRALAREQGVTIKNKPLEWADWGTIIREIEKKVDIIEAKAHAGLEKDAALDFYRGAIGEFRAFKDVYRNPTMHPRKIYDEYEAGNAMQHISRFMKKLSTRISERTRKSINWKLKYSP